MRLAFSLMSIFKIGEKYYTRSFVPNQLMGFKPFVEGIEFFGHVCCDKQEDNHNFQELDTSFFCIHGLPWHKNPYLLYLTKFPAIIKELVRIFQRESQKWDAIILYQFDIPNQIIFTLAKIYNIPVIFWLGGYPARQLEKQLAYLPIIDRMAKYIQTYQNLMLLRMFINKSEGVVATGKDLAHHVSELHSNVCHFTASGSRMADIEEHLVEERCRRLDGPFKILTVGRLVPVKGIEYLIEAAAILLEENIPVLLEIVGPWDNPSYFAQLTQLVRNRGIENQVIFPGRIPHGAEIFRLYREADVFALPSISEGTPKVLPEAMAKGLPIVATKVGGIPDQITDGVNGLLVNPGRVDELATALKSLYYNSELRYSMGREALKEAARYTIESQIGSVARWMMETLQETKPDLLTERSRRCDLVCR